jgi:hypothetical protein
VVRGVDQRPRLGLGDPHEHRVATPCCSAFPSEWCRNGLLRRSLFSEARLRHCSHSRCLPSPETVPVRSVFFSHYIPVLLSLDLPMPRDAPRCHGNLSTHRTDWQLFANPEDAGGDGANRGIACDEVDGGVADLADSLGNLRRGMYGPVTPLSERAAAEATETAA